jgi:dihydrofolate reductase
MRAKTSVFIATSLDGFIARKDGNLDWLDKFNATAPAGEDCGYNAFFASIDALAMGRKTYEKILTFGEWPYGSKQVIVMSRSPVDIPKHLQETVSASSETPRELVDRLSAQGSKHLYIDGGMTIQGFLQAGVLDEMTLTLIPVVIGDGIPLFGYIKSDVELSLIESKAYEFGCVQVKYRVRRLCAEETESQGASRPWLSKTSQSS